MVRGLGPGVPRVPWAHLDPAFAKYQLAVLLREWFLHPNGALPAYEWNFDDVNPPVHALAAIRVFVIDGSTDIAFLERVFQKLLVNFTWWVNRQDPDGNNLFGGGFLGLDNICPVDRSSLPAELRIEQADGTAWMAYYALAMLELARALAVHNPVYDDMVVKFLEHFVLITEALDDSGLLDPDDAFFYDRLIAPTERDADPGPVAGRRVPGAAGRLDPIPTRRSRPLRKHFARRLEATSEARARVAAPARARAPAAGVDGLARAVRTGATLFDEEASCRRTACARSRSATRRPTSAGRPGREHRVRARRVADRHVRRELQLARSGVAADQLPGYPGAVQYDQFFGADRPIEYPTGSGGSCPSEWPPTSPTGSSRSGCRTPTDAAGERPPRRPRRPRLERPPAVLRVLPRRPGDGPRRVHQTGWTALVVDLIIDPPGVRPGRPS